MANGNNTESKGSKMELPEFDWDVLATAGSDKSTTPIWSGYVSGEIGSTTGEAAALDKAKNVKAEEKWKKEEKVKKKAIKDLFSSFLKKKKKEHLGHKTELKERGVFELQGPEDELKMFSKVSKDDIPAWRRITGQKSATDYVQFSENFIDKMKSDPDYAIQVFQDPTKMQEINELVKLGYLKPGQLTDIYLQPTDLKTQTGDPYKRITPEGVKLASQYTRMAEGLDPEDMKEFGGNFPIEDLTGRLAEPLEPYPSPEPYHEEVRDIPGETTDILGNVEADIASEEEAGYISRHTEESAERLRIISGQSKIRTAYEAGLSEQELIQEEINKLTQEQEQLDIDYSTYPGEKKSKLTQVEWDAYLKELKEPPEEMIEDLNIMDLLQ